MDVRGQHHVVELLGEHGRREERDRPQRLLASVGKIMPQRGRQDENAARPDLMLGAVFEPQFAGAGEDEINGALIWVKISGALGPGPDPSDGYPVRAMPRTREPMRARARWGKIRWLT